MITQTATPFSSTQDSNLVNRLTPSALNDRLKNGTLSATDKAPQQQGLSYCSKKDSRIHNFYTKASILMPGIVVNFEQVQVNERSPLNLLPLLIAIDLDLILYSHKTLTITIADRLIQTNQYC